MPKKATYPTLYNEVIQIHASKLKAWGYFKPDQLTQSKLTWWRGEHQRAAINFVINMDNQNPYIELAYNYNGIPRKYKLHLLSVPSNLGKGEIYFFLCPFTLKLCRKLYMIEGYFTHRTAFGGVYYEKQILSSQQRFEFKNAEVDFRIDLCYAQLFSKHFKKLYSGKPTKRYLKLLASIERGER